MWMRRWNRSNEWLDEIDPEDDAVDDLQDLNGLEDITTLPNDSVSSEEEVSDEEEVSSEEEVSDEEAEEPSAPQRHSKYLTRKRKVNSIDAALDIN